ncbi:hypothetical protein Taro_008017 [Colocasia esculenta]|uniref:Uncharacterized protein n=1 Tax=Colocasia esculenta TaxID=4460 RepID=A0A843U191_COLES|nr:hypothetical protein [Colocasia esculenta]
MEIATFTEVSYPNLVKAFYVCLRSEADGSLVSSVKGIPIKVDHELLHMLFGVKTSGFSGVHAVNDEAKGLGIIVVEKMGQCIRSRNLKKSGFSVIEGVWSKTTVAEGEAIIGDAVAPAEQQQAEETPAEQQQAEESVAEQQAIAPAVQPESLTASVVEEEVADKTIESVLSTRMDSQSGEVEMEDAVAEGHIEEAIPMEQSSAPVDQVEEEAPAQGEQIEVEEEAPAQGEQSIEEPTPQRKGKRVVHRKFRQSHRKVNLNPVLDVLKAQGEILSAVQSSVQGIIASQASTTSVLSSVRNAMKWFNKEMSDMKSMLAVLSRPSGASPTATQSRPVAVPRPPGPPAQESRPAGPSVQASGPSGPPVSASGSSGPSSVVKEGQDKGKEPMTASKAPDTSTLATPTLSSPSSPSTAPPAPPTVKHPVPRTQPSSSLISCQPSFSPTPSLTSAPSSFNSKPSPPSSFNPKHLFYPPNPPSSVTIIPEKPSLLGVFDTNLPDDFERNILITILSTATHIHRTDPPSPAKKKRKQSSSVSIPSSPLFPPLWYSLTLEPQRRSLYKEYVQKCILSTIYGIPFLNLSEHLTIVLPLTQLSHPQKSKIFEGTEFKAKDQWANVKGNKAQYSKYLLARAESLTHRAHPLTLSEWFIIQHKNSWGPFILKEIRIAKNFQLYSDFCYLNKLPEVQFYQFHSALVMLRSERPVNLPLTVDFANLKVDSPVLLPKLHSLVFDSDAGSHALDMFARQMGHLSAKLGRLPSFLRFIFREYHSGRISSQTLAPLISESERLTPTIWETIYKEPHLQLQTINSSLVRQAKPILSAEAFMDLNSINPIQEIYVQWAARYTTFYALKQDLLDQKIFYPISLDRFLHRASFGKSTYFRFILDPHQYEEFLEKQRQLYIQRPIPSMGPNFSVVSGVFQQTFEDLEIKAWAVISQHAS